MKTLPDAIREDRERGVPKPRLNAKALAKLKEQVADGLEMSMDRQFYTSIDLLIGWYEEDRGLK